MLNKNGFDILKELILLVSTFYTIINEINNFGNEENILRAVRGKCSA
jgi:hypothetical protein